MACGSWPGRGAGLSNWSGDVGGVVDIPVFPLWLAAGVFGFGSLGKGGDMGQIIMEVVPGTESAGFDLSSLAGTFTGLAGDLSSQVGTIIPIAIGVALIPFGAKWLFRAFRSLVR